jgi:hypothetical protein
MQINALVANSKIKEPAWWQQMMLSNTQKGKVHQDVIFLSWGDLVLLKWSLLE